MSPSLFAIAATAIVGSFSIARATASSSGVNFRGRPLFRPRAMAAFNPAPRRENGDYAGNPGGLFRVFDPRSTGEGGGTRDVGEPCLVRQSEQGSETRETA